MGMFDVLKKDYKPQPKEKMQAEGKPCEIQLGYVTGASHDYSRSSLLQKQDGWYSCNEAFWQRQGGKSEVKIDADYLRRNDMCTPENFLKYELSGELAICLEDALHSDTILATIDQIIRETLNTNDG